jgi:hypothetical protein
VVKDLGMSRRELDRELKICTPAVGYAVERGKSFPVKMDIV